MFKDPIELIENYREKYQKELEAVRDELEESREEAKKIGEHLDHLNGRQRDLRVAIAAYDAILGEIRSRRAF